MPDQISVHIALEKDTLNHLVLGMFVVSTREDASHLPCFNQQQENSHTSDSPKSQQGVKYLPITSFMHSTQCIMQRL